MEEVKICTKCSLPKNFTEFNKHHGGKFGLAAACRLCANKRLREYVKNNKSLKAEQNRKWNEENREYRRELSKQWCKMNKEKRYSLNAKRRASLISQTPEISNLEKSAIEALYFISKVLSNSCGEKFHVDHMHPISKGGSHTFDNLQILTAEENRRKGDRI